MVACTQWIASGTPDVLAVAARAIGSVERVAREAAGGVRASEPSDAFGRPSLWLAFGLLVFVLVCLVVGGLVGEDPSSRSWPERLTAVLAFWGWAVYTFGVLWVLPSPVAYREGEVRVLRATLGRRIALTFVSAPVLYFVGVVAARGESVVVAPLLWIVVAGILWAATAPQVRLTRERVEFIGLRRRSTSLRWCDVARVHAMGGGIVLEGEGKKIEIWNRFLAGYPEFAAAALEHVRADVLDASGARAVLDRQAALFRAASNRGSD